MTKEEYINSLSVDELRAIAREFYEWFNDDGCPICDNDAPCPCGKTDEEQDEIRCRDDQGVQALNGCWLKYYVWRYRQKREGLAKLRSMPK